MVPADSASVDPVERLAFLPPDWALVRPLVQLVILVPLVGVPPLLVDAAVPPLDNDWVASLAALSADALVVGAGWQVRRRFSRLVGTSLLLGGALHAASWLVLLALALVLF